MVFSDTYLLHAGRLWDPGLDFYVSFSTFSNSLPCCWKMDKVLATKDTKVIRPETEESKIEL